MKPKFILLIASFLAAIFLQAQPCKITEDLVKLPGVLKPDLIPGFTRNSTFLPSEGPAVMKTLDAAVQIMKKNFSLQGGVAKYWYKANFREHFDVYEYPSYELVVAFYQDVCFDGKKTFSSEYTVDFAIRANHEFIYFDNGPGYTDFYEDKTKYGDLPISIFTYLSYPLAQAEKMNSGKGYFEEDDGNKFRKHSDVYRRFFITKEGMPLLVAVSRKELLESLLELYEREKKFHVKRLQAKLDESVRYMAQYEKSENKSMYQNHLENKQKAEKDLADLDGLINKKKAEVEGKLKTESSQWLAAPATHKFHDTRFVGDRIMESSRFKGFYDGPDANTVYRFNPALAATKKTRTGEPLFFYVRYRYKSGETFSQQITDGFVKNFDFEALRKLL